ncbi:hypothetical protein J4217_02290 [Candidatus Pacearchaeota archaeon]|nr:hypothetical protein [Candidatus Pacearchaeota archaeon]
MNKAVRIILLDEARDAFEKLNFIVGKQVEQKRENTSEMQLLNSINQKISLIKSNPFYGDNLKKELIPNKYKVQNLWRVELSQFWRMLYTIKGDQIEVICFILDIVDHPSYDKIFGYKKK